MSIGATIQLRRGLEADLGTAAPADGEPLWTTDTHVLYVGQGGTAYQVTSTPSPLTTKGDVYVYGAADDRLPVGTDGQVLLADSGEPTGLRWGDASTAASPLTTKGDLWAYSTTDDRLPVGTDGYVLQAFSGGAGDPFGMLWAQVGSNSIAPNAVLMSHLADLAGYSVIGRAASSAGDPAAITAGSNGHCLRRSGGTNSIAFGPLDLSLSGASVENALNADHGGTGHTTYNVGEMLACGSTDTLAKVSRNTTTTRKFLRQVGDGSAAGFPSWDTLASGDLPTVPETKGGTNQTTYTTGDILYASAANTLSKRAVGSTGDFLWVTGGVPAWHAPAMEDITGYCTSLTNSGSITASNGTWTNLTWDTEASDDAGLHSTVTNTSRITIPAGKGGVYILSGICQFDANATGLRSVRFIVNGTTVIGEVGGWTSANTIQIPITRQVRLSAGDFVVMQAYQTSGGNLNLNPSSGNYLSVAYLGK